MHIIKIPNINLFGYPCARFTEELEQDEKIVNRLPRHGCAAIARHSDGKWEAYLDNHLDDVQLFNTENEATNWIIQKLKEC